MKSGVENLACQNRSNKRPLSSLRDFGFRCSGASHRWNGGLFSVVPPGL